jgi:hypothetical protein
MTWLGYSRTMAMLPVEVPFALFTNLLLLFCVALEPYLFYVLSSVQTVDLLDSASIAYAFDVGGLFFLQAALAYLVVKQGEAGLVGRQRIHPVVLARFRRVVKLDAIIGVVFVVSALPIFWVSTPIGYLRFDLWFSSFFIFLLGRGSRKSVSKES